MPRDLKCSPSGLSDSSPELSSVWVHSGKMEGGSSCVTWETCHVTVSVPASQLPHSGPWGNDRSTCHTCAQVALHNALKGLSPVIQLCAPLQGGPDTEERTPYLGLITLKQESLCQTNNPQGWLFIHVHNCSEFGSISRVRLARTILCPLASTFLCKTRTRYNRGKICELFSLFWGTFYSKYISFSEIHTSWNEWLSLIYGSEGDSLEQKFIGRQSLFPKKGEGSCSKLQKLFLIWQGQGYEVWAKKSFSIKGGNIKSIGHR